MQVEDYDVIVIGSGFGGSFAAYALVKAGFKTLLLEKGGWVKRDSADWDGQEILVKKRYKSASPMLVKQNGNRSYDEVHPDEVVGGNSIFFFGASLRMRERDLTSWPIDYADLEPYYAQAEQLLEVHGEMGSDPYEPTRSWRGIKPGIPLTTPARRIYRAAEQLGYRPFKMPIAINYRNLARPICVLCNTCDGFPCKIGAKNDLVMTVLRQAQDFGLEIRTGIIAKRVVEKNGTITGVIQDIYTPPRKAIEHFAPRGLKRLVGITSENMQNLLCIAEDDPRIENGVTLSNENDLHGLPRIEVKHRYTKADYRRRNYLAAKARKVLRRAGALAHYLHEIDTFSHALGTVRFGSSPETSVLDENCRFHGIDNLFVLDGSFMPSSTGINPSLTIAANSLRVADHIIVNSGKYLHEEEHLYRRLWENWPAPRQEPGPVL